MRYPLLATVTRAGSTGERRRRNPLTRSETAGVLRAARGAAQLAATSPAGGGPGVARAFWTGKAERGFEIAAGMLGAPSRGRRLRAWRAADPLRRTGRNPDPPPEYWDLMRQADKVYSEMYRIRQRHFQPTHIGLGTWGRHLPLGPQVAARVAELQRERARLLSRARTLKRRHERPAAGGPQSNPVGRRLRVVIGHSGLARFMAQVEGPIGSVPREIRTPYAYGPTHAVWSWRGVPVVIAETRHRRHEVFRVEGPIGPVDNPRRPRRARTVPERHQLRIARQTLRMPAAMVGVMGGPSKREARRIVRRLRGNPRLTTVPAVELRPGDVILPPAREVTLWMRRYLRERGLPESALELTVVSVRPDRSDQRGPWLIVTTRQSEAWLAGRPGYPFTFKARPATPWPLVRSGPRANPRLTKIALRRAGGYPVGAPAPLELRCPCGETLPVPASGHVTCPRCGAVYNRQGWVVKAGRSNPRRAGGPRARFCPERLADPRAFDPRSFRTVVRRGHPVTVGCPRGRWDPRHRRCRVGTRAQRVLHPAGEGRCPLPGRELRNPARTVRTTTRSTTTRLTVRRNPRLVAAACALCRREPRAPMSPYCRKCLQVFQRGPRRNPPRGGVVIYDRLVELRAVKGRRSRFPGKPFKHRFTSRAKVIGLPDGSVLLKGPRPLWNRVEV